MVSIRASLAELDKAYEMQNTLLDCYRSAIRTMSQYAVELDEEITPAHQQHLTAIAVDLEGPFEPGRLAQSGSVLRNELRDYRDRAATFLKGLRNELALRANALQAIVEAMASAEGDHEEQLQNGLIKLRKLADSPAIAPLRADLLEAADQLQASVEQLKRSNGLTVSQFMVEIKALHRRIEVLETAGRKDVVTGLNSRLELETRIAGEIDKGTAFSLILLHICNLPVILRQFGTAVRSDVVTAFAKRLVGGIPADAIAGRWAEDRFILLLSVSKTEAISLGRQLNRQVSGTYVCMQHGKPQRPSLTVNMSVIDHLAGASLDSLISRLNQL